MKKICKKLLLFGIVLLILDFIPIKWAVKIQNINSLKDNEYLCSFAQVTGGNWVSENNYENYKNNQLYFEYLQDRNPFNVLDKNFSTDYLEPSGNMYIFTGEVLNKEYETYDLRVEKWEIVYPIQRKSIRMLYAPPKYLTIYDYDWIKLVQKYFW